MAELKKYLVIGVCVHLLLCFFAGVHTFVSAPSLTPTDFRPTQLQAAHTPHASIAHSPTLSRLTTKIIAAPTVETPFKELFSEAKMQKFFQERIRKQKLQNFFLAVLISASFSFVAYGFLKEMTLQSSKNVLVFALPVVLYVITMVFYAFSWDDKSYLQAAQQHTNRLLSRVIAEAARVPHATEVTATSDAIRVQLRRPLAASRISLPAVQVTFYDFHDTQTLQKLQTVLLSKVGY